MRFKELSFARAVFTGKKPITLRLPPKLLATVRRDAKRAGQTISEFVAAKLHPQG